MRRMTSKLLPVLFALAALPLGAAVADDNSGGEPTRQQLIDQVRAACESQVPDVCPGISDKREILNCLSDNKAKVTQQCSVAVEKLEAEL